MLDVEKMRSRIALRAITNTTAVGLWQRRSEQKRSPARSCQIPVELAESCGGVNI
jgi:hypothetical protein